jgi:acyl-CoA thioester hydrolase
MISYDYRFRVRYKDIDQMGVMYYSRYYEYYEAARTDLMHDLGLSYKELEEQGIMMPVVHSESDYFSGPRFDDELIITTQVREMQASRMVIHYEMHFPNETEILNSGMSVHAFVKPNGKATRMPKNLQQALMSKWG